MTTQEQHQELPAKYTEAIVKVGLNLRQGQRLAFFQCGTTVYTDRADNTDCSIKRRKKPSTP